MESNISEPVGPIPAQTITKEECLLAFLLFNNVEKARQYKDELSGSPAFSKDALRPFITALRNTESYFTMALLAKHYPWIVKQMSLSTLRGIFTPQLPQV